MTSSRLTFSALISCSILFASQSSQNASADPRPFRPDYYDATNTDLVKNIRLDWNAIHQNAASNQNSNKRGLRFGAPTVEVRRNFVYVEDSDGGNVTLPFQRQSHISDLLNFGFEQLYSVLPDEFTFVYFFSVSQSGLGAYFYAPQANLTRGIGQFLYDETGSSPLEGYVFMNDWRSFERQWGSYGAGVVEGFARHTFNQEAGHRWMVQFDVGNLSDGKLQKLLGRDDAHWSFFMHSAGSPMEGNAWRDNGDGTFTTRTTYTNYYYNDVDLYMMGLMQPTEVDPWFIIDSPSFSPPCNRQTGRNCDLYGQTPNRSSPPQISEPVTASGTRLDYTIEDLVNRIGFRDPPVGQAPTSWRSAFVIVAAQGRGMNEQQKLAFETMVDGYATGFGFATRGLGQLDYVLNGSPLLPIGAQCSTNTQCDPNDAALCTVPSGSSQSICTRPCDDNSACPVNWCCIADANGLNACHPDFLCPAPSPDAGVSDGGSDPDAGSACSCDQNAGCDQGCACDPECAAPMICACDTHTDCQAGCDCDPECGPCACDQTFACDGLECTCDPECTEDELARLRGDGGCRALSTGGGFGGLASVLILGVFAMILRRLRRVA